MLDERLKACADFVSGKGIACDVGTDHAYLACELIKSKKCIHVKASDINEKPLKSAKNTVEKYNFSDKIDLILSDGLKNIPAEGVTDVIIAGMGGETIIDIIKNSDWVKNNVNLILQPMTKAPELRIWLYANGFKIIQEKAVKDGKFIYTVMKSEYCGKKIKLSEFSSIAGHLDFSIDISEDYLEYQQNKILKISEGLEESGDIQKSIEKKKICTMLGELKKYGCIREIHIYSILDELYPFSSQEKWDNSGYLVGDMDIFVKKVMLSLDITSYSVNEAKEKKCNLIVSHHPVIFEPLKNIHNDSVVYKLIKSDIGAICMHTNLDIAEDGTNGVIVEKLSEYLKIKSCESFDEIGKIINLENPVSAKELAGILKKIFGCTVVRYCGNWKYISRIAICSGSGGSMLYDAMKKDCHALITGDVKHDVWISAGNNNFNLFDCGHFHTENLVLEHLRDVLEANFPFIETIIAESSFDPVEYI